MSRCYWYGFIQQQQKRCFHLLKLKTLPGRIDENVEQELPNPYPGTSINSVTTIGGSSSVGTLNDEEKQKFKENFIEQEKQFASNLEDIIKKAFPTGFPFN